MKFGVAAEPIRPASSGAGREPGLPVLSGDRCIGALILRGWLPVDWSEWSCTLAKDGRRMILPRDAVIDPEALAGLLRQGGVSRLEFIGAIERLWEHPTPNVDTPPPRRG